MTAQLDKHQLGDFCVTALTEAAGQTMSEHQTVVLSERDREVFFDALVNPPEANERLRRAFAEHRSRVVR